MMNADGRYIQYSKIFVGIAGIAYLVELVAIIVLVCMCHYAANALLNILSTTTGLVGIIFGCYTGNSAAEKYIKNKASVSANATG